VKTQNQRKVKWDTERQRAYVLRDGVRYWAPQETSMLPADDVVVFSPDTRSVTVRGGGARETWLADATSTGVGG
jgi:hypothetical protein